MEHKNYAVGLDIGTTKIVAMVGSENEYGKIEILGIGKSKSLGVHRGVVNNITQTIQSIQQAVQEAESAAGIEVEDVVVGIAGQHIRSLQHSDYITRPGFDDVIDDSDIEALCNQVHKLVMLPGEEIIHVLPQEYKVDGQTEIKEPIGMYGGRLEANFHVVVGQVSSIRNIGRCVKSAGLELGGINLEPLASANAVLSQEEKEAGVALIDIGGGTTDLAIFKDGIIRHTAVIPFGGNVITEDIKEGCSIIEKQAELLKTKFGSAWPGENKDNEIVSIPGLRGREPKEITLKNLSKIIHARVVEIIEQVFVEIKNYGHEEQKKKLIAGIVLTGGGSQLRHLKQLVEYITGMDTRIGYPNEHLAGNSDSDVASPVYATAVGLVMKALENNKLKPVVEELEEVEEEIPTQEVPEIEETPQQPTNIQPEPEERTSNTSDDKTRKKSFLDKFTDRLKDFLDNAE
ncbi:cell division protein FtsA [Pustulibacterium marinum]|uniref:Cell division protein FtsA n=1 Tax=Pustulibacterium marinum TaxID=1224947 RepID=A0A1I7GLM8_9FLAO|nr:cell division protein FtsA [Pustulibacterium marinum]SFU49347.1 cell division protein FtsA [Pustulibacterium marinum]